MPQFPLQSLRLVVEKHAQLGVFLEVVVQLAQLQRVVLALQLRLYRAQVRLHLAEVLHDAQHFDVFGGELLLEAQSLGLVFSDVGAARSQLDEVVHLSLLVQVLVPQLLQVLVDLAEVLHDCEDLALGALELILQF